MLHVPFPQEYHFTWMTWLASIPKPWYVIVPILNTYRSEQDILMPGDRRVIPEVFHKVFEEWIRQLLRTMNIVFDSGLGPTGLLLTVLPNYRTWIRLTTIKIDSHSYNARRELPTRLRKVFGRLENAEYSWHLGHIDYQMEADTYDRPDIPFELRQMYCRRSNPKGSLAPLDNWLKNWAQEWTLPFIANASYDQLECPLYCGFTQYRYVVHLYGRWNRYQYIREWQEINWLGLNLANIPE